MVYILIIFFNLNLFSQEINKNFNEKKSESNGYFDNISINIEKRIVFDTNRFIFKPLKIKEYFDNFQIKNISFEKQIDKKNITNLVDEKVIKIYNVFGNEMNKLNLSELSPGLYFIVYQNENILRTKKIKIE